MASLKLPAATHFVYRVYSRSEARAGRDCAKIGLLLPRLNSDHAVPILCGARARPSVAGSIVSDLCFCALPQVGIKIISNSWKCDDFLEARRDAARGNELWHPLKEADASMCAYSALMTLTVQCAAIRGIPTASLAHAP